TTAWSSPPAWHATKAPAAALRNSSPPTASRRRTAAPDTRKPKAKSNASTKPSNAGWQPDPSPTPSTSSTPCWPTSKPGTTPPAEHHNRPTQHCQKRPPPDSTAPNGAPAPTKSTRTENSPSATPASSATSASAEPTLANPCSCSSTTATSPSATQAREKSSP